ncbi:peptidoglycan-binding protein, partial [Arthrobacter sp. UM1]|nr:peptidoglycan-binding protein [Arthrobacter sp. UM1]
MTALVAALGAGVAAPAQAAPDPVGNLASSSCPAAIKQGQTNGCVTRLQNLLNAKQGSRLVVDGVFGKATTAAVKQWQSAHHLAVDGVVGRATKASIDPTSAPAPTPVPAPSKGSHNAAVVASVNQVMHGYLYPYVWGGGHGAKPGPTKGGMDCSGFTRWVYSKA